MNDFNAGVIVGVTLGGIFGFLFGLIVAEHEWSKKLSKLCPDCGEELFYYWTDHLFICTSCNYEKKPLFARK